MKKKTLLLCFILVASLLGGCVNLTDIENSNNNTSDIGRTTDTIVPETDKKTEITDTIVTNDDAFTDRDGRNEYDESGSIKIQLNGNAATANHSSVRIAGTTITLTSDKTTDRKSVV